jgi:methionyl aminopeptidase
MMIIKSEEDLIGLRRIGKIVALVREEMIKNIRPGITTAELDTVALNMLTKHGAKSAPKLQYNFPGTTCISVNDEVAHGIPGTRVLRNGDLVNVDVSAELDGYFADTGASIAIDPVSELQQKLCDCSQTALKQAIAAATTGNKINQIGKAIQNEAQKCGFTVIKNLCGHGIGKKLHENPQQISNYYRRSDQLVLGEGLVIALETFISARAEHVVRGADRWTLKTPDGSLAAQYEHTIVVTKGVPIILTEL